MWKNFFGNILALLVDSFFIYSAYMASPVFLHVWEGAGIVAVLDKRVCYAMMSLGSALAMSWVRRLFK